jgi:hypothetical protein
MKWTELTDTLFIFQSIRLTTDSLMIVFVKRWFITIFFANVNACRVLLRLVWNFIPQILLNVRLATQVMTKASSDLRQTLAAVFFPWRWGGSDPSVITHFVSILRISQIIWVWRATVELYWQGKTEELGEKPVPVPLCPPQIPHGLTPVRIRAPLVRGRRLTTWAMARPSSSVSPFMWAHVRDTCAVP